MVLNLNQIELITGELVYKALRSSGPGGQNVNKVSSKIELRYNIEQSQVLNQTQKDIIFTKLKNRINTDGQLVLVNQNSRSQLKNKIEITAFFIDLIQNALTPRIKRVATKPTKLSLIKKAESKRKMSEKKLLRRKPFND